MANLPDPAVFTANGDFDIEGLAIKEHILTLKGTFDGATVTLTCYNDALGEYTAVTGGVITADFEDRMVPPSSKARFTVSGAGAGTEIGLTLKPIS